jgi:hypothetical protein
MAYNCPDGGCERILRFSDPNLSTSQGIPYGTAQEDNARYIRERLHILANFRPTVVATEPSTSAQLAAPPTTRFVAVVYPRGTNELETVERPGPLIGAAGNMFEVIAKKDLRVAGFAVTAFASTTVTVEVYKLKATGTFAGQEYNPGAWTLIGGATIQTKANAPTPLPPGSISGTEVRQGTVQAFYVTFKADTNYNRYSRASQIGLVFTQNDDIQFKVVRFKPELLVFPHSFVTVH